MGQFEPLQGGHDQIRSLVGTLARRGVNHVVVSGGEPTQSPHLRDVVSCLLEANVGCSLSTNALAIDKILFQELKATGLSKITVSVDGATAPVHDKLRGPDSFARTTRNILLLKELGFQVTVASLMHAEALRELHLLPRLCHQLGIDRLDLFAPVRTPYCTGRVETVAESEARAQLAANKEAFDNVGLSPQIVLPVCSDSRCPSGSQVLGVVGGKVRDRCVFK